MVTCGRKRDKKRKQAMPFHSTVTEEEANLLVSTFCKLGWDGYHRIRADWADGDILAAMESAKGQFQLGG